MNTIELLIDRMERARAWSQSLLADVDESRWFEPPGPGLGHVAWQIGHIAASQIVLVHMRCFGRQFADVAPAEYYQSFARGSTPVADPNKYPPIGEIRDFFARTHRGALELARTIRPEQLTEPTHGDPHPMFNDKAGALAMSAMHESFHAGQIALIRRLWGKAALR